MQENEIILVFLRPYTTMSKKKSCGHFNHVEQNFRDKVVTD